MSKIVNILLSAVATLLLVGFSSCEKDWTCKCQTYGGPPSYIIIKDATEKEATELCTETTDRKLNGYDVSRCTLDGKYKGN